MNIRKITRLFQYGTVCVVGHKGTGKDVLFGNVIARRKLPYISNTDYGGDFLPLDIDKLRVNGNTYKNFISGRIRQYFAPYEDNTDVYVADVGVYFPSQYCSELNRDYKEIPVFEALSRHLFESRVHVNCQNLNRIWDKLREMSSTYIRCNFCKFFFGRLVFQVVTIYDKYQSCVDRVDPFKVEIPPVYFNLEQKRNFRMQQRVAYQQFKNTHGNVHRYVLVYWNKSKHNTRSFKQMLEEGTE